MKLTTVQTTDGPRPVAVHVQDGKTVGYWDILSADPSLPSTLAELLGCDEAIAKAQAAEQTCREQEITADGTPLPPIPAPGKIICIGLNYRDHALETGKDIPSEPVCFGKFGNTVIGDGDTIRLPAVCQKVDYEAELVVVIGKTASRVSADNARQHVAGYMNGHDVSARDWQGGRPGGQWLLGKSPDTFAPIGPYIVTADEVPDPENLRVQLRLNGETMQDGNTKEFIFGINAVIAHLSQLITLQPGDIIFTGTPPGVGMARKPPVFLKAGDTVEVEVEGLGVLTNTVEEESA